MNIIKLCGGLGNQIFQYAFGKAQMENGIEVLFDKLWFDSSKAKQPLRQYVLDKFKTDLKIIGRRSGKKIINEKGFDIELLHKDGFYFNGYWQYPEYSKNVLSQLQQELWVRKELYSKEFLELRQEIILNDNSVAVHVRRGDYLYLDGFPVMNMDYYNMAFEYIYGDLYVFSDDMDWCRKNFKNAKFIHLNEYFDFELMRLCKHQIISRSSFSWWAARLNSNLYKKVVVPVQQLECKIVKGFGKYGLAERDPVEWIRC